MTLTDDDDDEPTEMMMMNGPSIDRGGDYVV